MDSCLGKLGIDKVNAGAFYGEWHGHGPVVERRTPIDGRLMASVRLAGAADYESAVNAAHEAFLNWRATPAPVRGETIRRFGEALRHAKAELARLITFETGKIIAEAEGEVQEMIDICDFAVGLSRQLYGLAIASERPRHRLMEQWHPLGVVGVISAFNFPVAVWAWNAALAIVCGDAVVWKPSSKTPLSAIAVTKIAERVCRETNANPALFSLVAGGPGEFGEQLAADQRIPLVSATGSCEMGFKLARQVHGRLARTVLELGGNNAVIVTPSADLDLAMRAIFFGAIGTAGQRCTSTRRVIVHELIEPLLRQRLITAYRSLRIGDPLERETVMGPLIDTAAVEQMMAAMFRVETEGGRILCGGETLAGVEYPGGCYVTPCLAEVQNDYPIVKEETFAPLLYLISYRNFDEAIAMNNDVPQGLSSSVFTSELHEAEVFMSACGSDCGIANVNVGTSGAEIGGAFGGEKNTGGGRESGSDAWKNYMRRQTNTINASGELPLAQGIRFGGDL
jgi:aldehyde dehydrogenase (NAD+)